MADVLTTKQRKYCMSRIRGKDTKPEMLVRKVLHAIGYRYRLYVRSLPGCPDLVFPSRKAVVFVHGCFWHMHNCKYGKVVPKTRAKFWRDKREGNRERDRRNYRLLRKNGWRVMTVWECHTRKPERLLSKLVAFLEEG